VGSWVLVPCLVSLRGEFNAVSPGRDKSSDGSIGDAAHRASSSDHNPDETGVTPYEDGDDRDEVHAIDIDDTGPWPSGTWFDRKVAEIVSNHRYGRDNRLQNVIRNGRIASRSWGWTWREYTGKNPHREHAHFSARYDTAAENDTSSWGVAPPKEENVTPDQFLAILADPEVAARMKALAGAGVHDQRIGRSDETIGQDLQQDENGPIVQRLDALSVRLTGIEARLPEPPAPTA
jgi:hypothetical protein